MITFHDGSWSFILDKHEDLGAELILGFICFAELCHGLTAAD